jgi:hypothetical protein
MLQTFAEHAPAMRRAGWAVLPAAGKSPLMEGFNKWKYAPGEEAVGKWAQARPDADIVYVPGLCSTGRGKKGIVVVDADDAEAIGQADEIFGPTPGKVRTRRGQHRIFDGAGIDLGKLGSLRPFGLNIDIKHGQSGAGIVAAPPSPHEKDRSVRYAWEGCGETVIGDVPPFPVKALQDFLDKHPVLKPGAKPAAGPEGSLKLRDESRKQGLNDYLVSQVCFCASFDELLDVASSWNQNLSDHGHTPLADETVVKRANTVWQQHQEGRFEPMMGSRAACISDADEIRYLCALADNGGDACALLQLFRAEHGARCKRGETFRIAISAMVGAGVMGRWSARRYRTARDVLLEAGFIREVRPAAKGFLAEYALVHRVPAPAVRRRDARQ